MNRFLVSILVVLANLSSAYVFASGKVWGTEDDLVLIEEKYKDISFSQILTTAQKGDAGAQWYVGTRYLFSKRIENDIEKGIYWLNKSSEQGFIASHLVLGRLYCEGQKIQRDCNRGRKYLENAAPFDAGANIIIGESYARGLDTPKNREMAIKYLSKEKSQKTKEGRYWLGLMYHGWFKGYVDYKKSIPLIESAAKEGMPEAEYHMGYAYLKGEGVEKNISEGIRWLKISARNNFCLSQYVLAGHYANGIGVEKSIEKAFELAEKSIKAGCDDRDKLYEKLKAEMPNQGLNIDSVPAGHLAS